MSELDNKDLWKCCVKEPSETGKKVLCVNRGDFFVAIRLKEYYVPMPFADHYFSKSLSSPERWTEINFPGKLTGHIRVQVPELGDKLLTLAELEKLHPECFDSIAALMISSLSRLPKPDGMS